MQVSPSWDAIWPHVLVVHPGNVCSLCASATGCRRPRWPWCLLEPSDVVGIFACSLYHGSVAYQSLYNHQVSSVISTLLHGSCSPCLFNFYRLSQYNFCIASALVLPVANQGCILWGVSADALAGWDVVSASCHAFPCCPVMPGIAFLVLAFRYVISSPRWCLVKKEQHLNMLTSCVRACTVDVRSPQYIASFAVAGEQQ